MHAVVLYTLVGVCMRFNITVNVVTLLLIFYEWHSLNLNEVLSRKKNHFKNTGQCLLAAVLYGTVVLFKRYG